MLESIIRKRAVQNQNTKDNTAVLTTVSNLSCTGRYQCALSFKISFISSLLGSHLQQSRSITKTQKASQQILLCFKFITKYL